MRERERAHIPLMFIDQPTEHLPKSMMQYSYSSLRDQTLPPTLRHEESPIAQQPTEVVQGEFLQEVVKKVTEEVDDQVVHHAKKGKEKKTKFADLTIEEKIKYCMKTSPYIPPITCAIKTDSITIVGTIGLFEDGVVHVKSNKNSTAKKVNIDEITHIRMIGF